MPIVWRVALTGPLDGIRIIDLTKGIAGPFTTKLLADYGADVVKVERPGGDPGRYLGPFPGDVPHLEKSGLFNYLNTNKRSVVLDLATAAGREAVLDLVRAADAVVENFVPGTLANYGLSFETLIAANPRLVLTSVTPFGQEGPAATRKETDLTIFARSGWILQIGEPDDEPLKYYGHQSYMVGGLHAAWGTVTGLFHALETGEGQWVDASIFEAAYMVNDQALVSAAYVGHSLQQRSGRRIFRFPPLITAVADGYVSMLISDQQWPRFCRMADQPELAVDPDYATQDRRAAHLEELEVAFVPWFLTRTKQEVFDIAQAHGVPIAPFNDVSELLADPHYNERGMFETVVHPVLGPVKMSGRPLILSATPWQIRRPAPLLNQHAAEILGDRAAQPEVA